MERRSVVVTAPDVTESGYSGMGLRHVGLATTLAEHHDVTVLVGGDPGNLDRRVNVSFMNSEPGARALLAADVVISANAVRARYLPRLRGRLMLDLYDPSYFEWLTLDTTTAAGRRPWMARQIHAWRVALTTADAVFCANERQRDLYLGMLLGGSTTRRQLSFDEGSLRARILVVPNGMPAEPPPALEGARNRLGFSPDDVVFLWGGGVWDWLDWRTVVEAAIAAHAQNESVKLVFLGLSRGSVDDPHATRTRELVSFVESCDPTSQCVHYNEQWVSPAERADYLAAANAAVLGQYNTLETRFSFRTRFVDCAWASLPIVTMNNDALSEKAANEGWALLSAPGDVQGMTRNMLAVANDRDLQMRMASAVAAARGQYSWAHAAAPVSEAINALTLPTTRQRIDRMRQYAPSVMRTAVERYLPARPRSGQI